MDSIKLNLLKLAIVFSVFSFSGYHECLSSAVPFSDIIELFEDKKNDVSYQLQDNDVDYCSTSACHLPFFQLNEKKKFTSLYDSRTQVLYKLLSYTFLSTVSDYNVKSAKIISDDDDDEASSYPIG